MRPACSTDDEPYDGTGDKIRDEISMRLIIFDTIYGRTIYLWDRLRLATLRYIALFRENSLRHSFIRHLTRLARFDSETTLLRET